MASRPHTLSLVVAIVAVVGAVRPVRAQPSTTNLPTFRSRQFELLGGKVFGQGPDTTSSPAIPRAFAAGIRWNREAGAWRVDAWRVNLSRTDGNTYQYGGNTNTQVTIDLKHFWLVTAGGDAVWRRGDWMGSLGGGIGITQGQSHRHSTYDATYTNSAPTHSEIVKDDRWMSAAWSVGVQGAYEPVVVGLHWLRAGPGDVALLMFGFRY